MKIFIDAGHNDKKVDIGAEGNGLREQDITFSISQLLKQSLIKNGIEVKLSRENKEDILGYDLSSSLSQRAEMANKWEADLFISIHCNSAEQASANGTEVYVYSGSTISDLADKICKKICNTINTRNRGVKTANFAVLRKSAMPAMLIECAFINNQNDAYKLKNNQKEIVDAICSEIITYYDIKNINQELEEINEIVEEFCRKGIITNKDLWLEKLKEDINSYWLARKSINYIINNEK